MALIFYYAPMSTASLTEAVLAELGVACERVKLDIDAGDTRKPAFLKINPNGRVPAIVHDGTAIWESSAITMYLGEIFGIDVGLYPPPGPKRGEAMKWISWTSATLGEAAGRLSAALPTGAVGGVQTGSVDFVQPEQRDAAALAKAKADVTACLAVLNDGLEGRAFLAGDYTLADPHLFMMVGWIAAMDVDLAPFANISGWMGRVSARPALAPLFAG